MEQHLKLSRPVLEKDSISRLLHFVASYLLFVSGVSSATCPDSLVGKATIAANDSGIVNGGLEWYAYFGEYSIQDTDSLVLEFTTIPFLSAHSFHGMQVGLDGQPGAATFFSMGFLKGVAADSLPYDSVNWNSIKVVLDYVTETYSVNVNGLQAGPYPMLDSTTYAVQAVRINYRVSESTDEKVGWFDNFSLIDYSNGISTIVFEEDFSDTTTLFQLLDSTNFALAPIGANLPPNCEVTAINSDQPVGLKNFTISQNYPNPFNPSTTIHFNLSKNSLTVLKIYDLQGRLVRTLMNSVLNSGEHQVVWDGHSADGLHVASGIYLYNIRAGNYSASRKMLLAR